MNKYTYEQKQMIINELNELLSKEELRKYDVSVDPDDNKLKIYEYMYPSKFTPSDLIRKRIKDLSLTFCDIKSKVGVRFKMMNKLIYQMVKDYGSDHLLILDVKDNVIYPIEYINDSDVVEVISE